MTAPLDLSPRQVESVKELTRSIAEASDADLARELAYCLGQMVSDLPTRRDWLDPVLERRARAVLAKAKSLLPEAAR